MGLWWCWWLARGCGSLGRRLSLRKVAGAYPINAALHGAFAHSKRGGNGADGVTGGKGADDLPVGAVNGCGLDSGAGCGYVFGAADGGGCYAGQAVEWGLGVLAAVGGPDIQGVDIRYIRCVAELGAADGVRGLGAGSKEDVRKGARLVALLVAVQRGCDAGPCFSCYGLRVVWALDPLRIGGASGSLGAVLDGPRHADQGGKLGFAVHAVPLAAGALCGFVGLVGGFEANGKLCAAAGFWELCDGGAVEAPRLAHDL